MAVVGAVCNTGSVSGRIVGKASIRGRVANKVSVRGTIVRPLALTEVYNGAYVVDPVFEAQTLHTMNKTMLADVTVNAIRVERMSNTHGTTVYIGMKGD